MIDWTTVIVPFRHDNLIYGGVISCVGQEGAVEWQTIKGRKIQGSHDSSIQLKSSTDHPSGTHLWISGNPSKFLQGHNIYGSDDLCSLVADMTRNALLGLGLIVEESDYRKWRDGFFSLKTVDINYMSHCGTREGARAILQGIQHTGCMRHSGRGEFSGSTLYFSKKSRRRAIKVYVKGDELQFGGRKHRLPDSLGPDKVKELMLIANDALRVELRLLSLELKDLNLQDGRAWLQLDVRGLHTRYIERIAFSPNIAVATSKLLTMPKYVAQTYVLWKEGFDIKTLMKPATYYRQRAVLRRFGVDIGAKCLLSK